MAAFFGDGLFEDDVEVPGGGLVDVPDGGEGCAVAGWA